MAVLLWYVNYRHTDIGHVTLLAFILVAVSNEPLELVV